MHLQESKPLFLGFTACNLVITLTGQYRFLEKRGERLPGGGGGEIPLESESSALSHPSTGNVLDSRYLFLPWD
jgi:hypothetical protein